MPGPARAGALIYASNPDGLATFYERLLGMQRRHANAERVVLESPDIQLLVHAMPEEHAATVDLTTPPAPRWRAAIKLFFTVPSLAQARIQAATLGGELFAEEWQGLGFRVCNARDPEGNIFHVREFQP